MLTTQYDKALPDIRVNAADPGYTATDLNGHSGPLRKAPTPSSCWPRKAAGTGSGRLVDRDREITWGT